MTALPNQSTAPFPWPTIEVMESVSPPSAKMKMEENHQNEDGQLNGQPLQPKATPKEPTSVSTDTSPKGEMSPETTSIPADTPATSTKGDTPQETAPSGVQYRVEYRTYDDYLVHSVNMNKHDFDMTNHSHQNKSHKHIFEIITIYRTNSSKIRTPANQNIVPLVIDTRKKVKMVIHSQAICHALRSVVRYYPGQDLLGESITIPAPYPILVHHAPELREFMERSNPSTQTGPTCTKEQDAYEHLKLLLDFLEEAIMPAVRVERERNEKDFWTSDMAWLALRPGTTWRTRLGGAEVVDDWTALVVESVSGGTLDFGSKPWTIRYWYLDFDGTWIGRRRDMYDKDVFDGEERISDSCREINDKEFQEPADDEPPPKRDDAVAELVAQGNKFFDLLNEKCQDHNGKTADFPYRQIEGLVMVDLKTYYLSNKTPDVAMISEDNTWVSDCICPVCSGRQEKALETKRTRFYDYDGLSIDVYDTLSDHQYFLLPKTIRAFVFKTRVWERLRISNLSEPEFQPQMMETLVMDPARRKTITALAGSYIRENQHKEKSILPPWTADFIPGKGQGQVFLLHGKPGVGKTYTAECIAQYTNRPLMVLTSSDIGTKPEEIENILMEKFKMAAGWGAILLIDEADVFMEQRSVNDLTRNSLVAGFLRALEFYEGILFLTTNRVGTFDDAFISRIHVKLYYPDFKDEERQQIWKTFMDKLTRDRGKTIRVSIDAKDYIKGEKIKQAEWNGREIRNAFQTAVALAEYEAEKDEEGRILLKDTHLSAIVDMSQDFKKYLVKVHGVDENKRALNQGIRNDIPDSRTSDSKR